MPSGLFLTFVDIISIFSLLQDGVLTMITLVFALTVAWLCRPGNRKRDNETAKKIRRQLAKLEHIRRRDLKRQRQHSEQGRKRESLQLENEKQSKSTPRKRDVIEMEPWTAMTSDVKLQQIHGLPNERQRNRARSPSQRMEKVFLEKIDELQTSKRQKKKNKIAESEVESTQKESSTESDSHRQHHKSSLNHEVHRDQDWLRQVRRSMKAELIGPTKSVQRSDSDSSSSRSTSSRSSKRESRSELLLSSPRKRRQRSEHRYVMDYIEATTPPYARSHYEHSDRPRRSLTPSKDRRTRSIHSKKSTPSAHSTRSRKEALLASPMKMESMQRPQNEKKLIATTPKLITDHQHDSSRSHRSHRSHRSRRHEDDSSRSSTSSRSRRKSSRHDSRRDLLLTTPKKRRDLLSAKKKSKKRKIAKNSPQVAGHSRHSDHQNRSYRNRAESALSSPRSSRSSTSPSSRSSKRESRRDLLLSSPKKRRQQMAYQQKGERENNATTPPYASGHHQSSKRRRHSHLSHPHKSHKPVQKTSLRRSTRRSKKGKASKVHSSGKNAISDLNKDLEILRNKTASKSLMKNNNSYQPVQKAANKMDKYNDEHGAKTRPSKTASYDVPLKKTKKEMNMAPPFASSEVASQRSLSESAKAPRSSEISDKSKKLLAVLDEIAPISQQSTKAPLKHTDSSQGLPPPKESSLNHSNKQQKLLDVNAITDASGSQQTCLLTPLENPLNLNEQKDGNHVSSKDVKHNLHDKSCKSLTIKDMEQKDVSNFPKPTDHSKEPPQCDLSSRKARKPNGRSSSKESQQAIQSISRKEQAEKVTEKPHDSNSSQRLHDASDSSIITARAQTHCSTAQSHSVTSVDKVSNSSKSGRHSMTDLLLRNKGKLVSGESPNSMRLPKNGSSRNDLSTKWIAQSSNRDTKENAGHPKKHRSRKNTSNINKGKHGKRKSSRGSADSTTRQLQRDKRKKDMKQHDSGSSLKTAEHLRKQISQKKLLEKGREQSSGGKSSRRMMPVKRHAEVDLSANHASKDNDSYSSKKVDSSKRRPRKKHEPQYGSNFSSRAAKHSNKHNPQKNTRSKHTAHRDSNTSSRRTDSSKEHNSSKDQASKHAKKSGSGGHSRNAKHSNKHHSTKNLPRKTAKQHSSNSSSETAKYSENRALQKYPTGKLDQQSQKTDSSKNVGDSKEANSEQKISIKTERQPDSSNSSKQIACSKRSHSQKCTSGNEEIEKIDKGSLITCIKYPRKRRSMKNAFEGVKEQYSSNSKEISEVGIRRER